MEEKDLKLNEAVADSFSGGSGLGLLAGESRGAVCKLPDLVSWRL